MKRLFAIYPVGSVDDGIALLTGVAAGDIHARVEGQLSEYAERARSFGAVTSSCR